MVQSVWAAVWKSTRQTRRLLWRSMPSALAKWTLSAPPNPQPRRATKPSLHGDRAAGEVEGLRSELERLQGLLDAARRNAQDARGETKQADRARGRAEATDVECGYRVADGPVVGY